MSLLADLVRLLRDENRDFDDGFDEITRLSEALIEDADPTLIPALEEHLDACLHQADFYGRDVIGEVLAGIAGADALPVLLRASSRDLGDDQDGFWMTVCELLEADPARARPAVLSLVKADDAALRAVGVSALDFIVSDGDLVLLLAALEDPHPGVRSAAAGPVGQLAGRLPEAVAPLTAALGDPDPQVRVSVLSALGHTGSAAAVPHVTRLTDDPDPRVREWVANALGQLPEPPP